MTKINTFLCAAIILALLVSCEKKNRLLKIDGNKGKEGLFEWQFPDEDHEQAWLHYQYSVEKWWGDFPKDIKVPPNQYEYYAWAIGPFTKYEHNPVLAPTPGAWDKGRFGGGVHNGAIIVKDDVFYYIYRGEEPRQLKEKPGEMNDEKKELNEEPKELEEKNVPPSWSYWYDLQIDYICDIGIATSKDGIHFEKDTINSPLFRKGENRKYSYEDANISKVGDIYYLFCNQWLWGNTDDLTQNGTFLATSKDLLHWTPIGIVFPNAKRTHRNGVVLQNPNNEAVKVNGKYVMYLNFGLIAYSTDMIHWESQDNPNRWPGDEGCFALCDHAANDPDHIVLFTGGNHTGHFYAIGEVLLSKKDLTKAIDYLPAPVLIANPRYPYEHGFTADAPYTPISMFSDCIFLNGITMYSGKWWVYYGGSEYYTCLATAIFK